MEKTDKKGKVVEMPKDADNREMYDAMERFESMLRKIGEVVRNQMLREPAKLDAGFMDLMALGRMGLDIRKLSPDLRHRLLQMLTSSAHDFIERWFESPMIKSLYGAPAFPGISPASDSQAPPSPCSIRLLAKSTGKGAPGGL